MTRNANGAEHDRSAMGASSTIRQFLRVLLVTQAFTVMAATQPSNTSNEFWPEFDFYVNLNEKSRLFFLVAATKQQDLNAYADGQFGADRDAAADFKHNARLFVGFEPWFRYIDCVS